MTLHKPTTIPISDHGFETPLRETDVFHPIRYVSGDFDFQALKTQAEVKAMNSAARIVRIHKLPPIHTPLQARDIFAKRILGLLTSSRYRRGSIHYVTSFDTVFTSSILDAIAHDNPLELILEFFAFKMRNCLRTFGQDGTEVDLSEASTIVRLYEIACAIRHLYPPGAIVKVATDGNKFHRALETPLETARKYSQNLQMLAAMMGVSDTVRILDEADYFDDGYMERTDKWYLQIRNEYFTVKHSDIVVTIHKLWNSMHYMLPISNEMPIEVVSLAFSRDVSDVTLRRRDLEAYHLRRHIQERALDATFQYVAVKKANPQMLRKIAPHALPCCAHPRPGYLGLYISGRGQTIFPHHSQGTTKRGSPNPKIDDIRLEYAADIRRNPAYTHSLRGLVVPLVKYPFSHRLHPFTFIET